MSIFRYTFKKFSNRQVQFVLLPAGSLCIFLATVLLPYQHIFIPIAIAKEPALQGNSNKINQAQLTPKQQQEIIEKNVRIRKLQEGIIDHKIKILGSRKKERTLLGELEKIEEELQAQKKILPALRAKSEKQELLLADKQEYLKQVLTEKRAHQVHVKNRLASYYRMGSTGLLNALFSSESLPDLIEFKEYFSIMVQHDHVIIQQYLAQINESNRAREDHAREKLRLMKLADELNEKEEELGRMRREKNILLKQVNTEKHLYAQAVKEIEDAVADLASTLHNIQAVSTVSKNITPPADVIETEKKKLPQTPVSLEGFSGQKGLLDPPVSCRVITLFGQEIKGKFDSSTISDGIDIMVKKDTEITAVYDGKIIHSGYLRGYGNLIIIDHGQQYFSLISRAAAFNKKEGTRVVTGEIIGMTGDGDPLYGEGLHFEIRKGSKPEDPLLWLKSNSLSQTVPALSE
jgi:septal ring factor EnvC (AmiA/AmiB activator)